MTTGRCWYVDMACVLKGSCLLTSLQREASEGRDRLSHNPANLSSASSMDQRVRQPYRWDQLTETAKHREIMNIYARASPRTRYFYDKAHSRNSVRQGEWVEENWAIRWYLWHSFRYRDNRDNRATRVATQTPAGECPAYWRQWGWNSAVVSSSWVLTCVGGSRGYYDTARSQFVA